MKFLTRKGKSQSRRPISRRPPVWCKYSPEEVEAFVIKLAKEGNPPSKIGIILRDQYGIPLVKPLVNKSIKEIMNVAGMKSEAMEDLNNVVKQASNLHRHLEKNKTDFVNKRSLELIVSKIRRLAKYYKKREALSNEWKYEPETIGLV